MKITKFIPSDTKPGYVYLPGGCHVPSPDLFPQPSRTRPALRVLNVYDYYGTQCPMFRYSEKAGR